LRVTIVKASVVVNHILAVS
jgi:hypothetical protein